MGWVVGSLVVVGAFAAVVAIARRAPVGIDGRRPALTRPWLRAVLVCAVLAVAALLILTVV